MSKIKELINEVEAFINKNFNFDFKDFEYMNIRRD
jgi:hypothetical protein